MININSSKVFDQLDRCIGQHFIVEIMPGGTGMGLEGGGGKCCILVPALLLEGHDVTAPKF